MRYSPSHADCILSHCQGEREIKHLRLTATDACIGGCFGTPEGTHGCDRTFNILAAAFSNPQGKTSPSFAVGKSHLPYEGRQDGAERILYKILKILPLRCGMMESNNGKAVSLCIRL